MENRIQIQATKPELPPYEEYAAEIRDIFETGHMTNNGPKLQKLREMLIERIGCENAELFVNGHAALVLALEALGLPEGGEVLTSPFTFASTTNAIVQCGLIPVFCDIDDTYNISVESIRRNITEKTCAVVAPHIFGIPCAVQQIDEIAKQYDLKVVYDAAQAFGTKINGVDIGCFGDVTMFSLHAIKVFNSVEGGLLTFRDPGLKERLEAARNFGFLPSDKENAVLCGMNAKLDEFRAAMGIVNLPHVDENIGKRKRLAEKYADALSRIPGVTTYPYEEHIAYNYAYFPVRIDSDAFGITRDELYQKLAEQGVGTRRLYSTLTCDFRSFCGHGYRQDVSYARELSQKSLDLPLYSTLTETEIDYIVKAVEGARR